MKCPHCPDATLLMSERQGVEIDYCPSCRGVWLDRGELDKLIERSVAQEAPRAAAPAMPNQAPIQPSHQPSHQPYQRRPDFVDSDYGKHHHRRKSWLSDIFD